MAVTPLADCPGVRLVLLVFHLVAQCPPKIITHTLIVEHNPQYTTKNNILKSCHVQRTQS